MMPTLDKPIAPPAFSPAAGLQLDDTIVAPATPPGPGARAILRLSGPDAWLRIAELLDQPQVLKVGRLDVALRLPDFFSPLPAHLQLGKAPRTFTGQEVAEVHVLSSPPLVQALLDTLLARGARLARPGEFTLRAFLAGKLDLTQAEAVLALTTSRDTDELRTALAQLAGGLARPLEHLREELLLLLAEVEAGLDFADEDLSFIPTAELARRIALTAQSLATFRAQLDSRGRTSTTFRVVFSGPPNAGKSSLFNALLGDARALVSPQPGTTRDYLTGLIHLHGIPVELIDTAGQEVPEDDIAQQAQKGRVEQLRQADLVLHCFPVTHEPAALTSRSDRVLPIATKCDLPHTAAFPADTVRTSTVTGAGLSTLRLALAERARAAFRPAAVAPSLTRCRGHVDRALTALEHAGELTLDGRSMELVAAELRRALDEIGAMVGAVYTEDLLDRVFGQFCIGK